MHRSPPGYRPKQQDPGERTPGPSERPPAATRPCLGELEKAKSLEALTDDRGAGEPWRSSCNGTSLSPEPGPGRAMLGLALGPRRKLGTVVFQWKTQCQPRWANAPDLHHPLAQGWQLPTCPRAWLRSRGRKIRIPPLPKAESEKNSGGMKLARCWEAPERQAEHGEGAPRCQTNVQLVSGVHSVSPGRPLRHGHVSSARPVRAHLGRPGQTRCLHNTEL